MTAESVFVGVDVTKHSLDIAVHEAADRGLPGGVSPRLRPQYCLRGE